MKEQWANYMNFSDYESPLNDTRIYKADEVDDEKVAIQAKHNAEMVVLEARSQELERALKLAEEHIKVRLPKGDAGTALVLLNITEALKEGEDGA